MKKLLPPVLQLAKLRAARKIYKNRMDRKRQAEDWQDPVYRKAMQERDRRYRLAHLARAGGHTPEAAI